MRDYPLSLNGVSDVLLPRDARVLTVTGNGQLRLWALMEELEPDLETRRFEAAKGWSPLLQDAGDYIGTAYIWATEPPVHVFELKEMTDAQG